MWLSEKICRQPSNNGNLNARIIYKVNATVACKRLQKCVKKYNIKLIYFMVNAENSKNMYNWLKSGNANAKSNTVFEAIEAILWKRQCKNLTPLEFFIC